MTPQNHSTTQSPAPLDPREALEMLQPSSLAELMETMSRTARLGTDRIELCAIVNAKSGKCSEDCAFCAQSIHHKTPAAVHPMLKSGEIVERARLAAEHGAVRFGIVTSGRGCPQGRDLDEILDALAAIRRERIIAPCVSLGLLEEREARMLKEAGAVRYHHNLEAGPGFFPKICASHSFEARVRTVEAAKAAGLEVCVGGIIGLGESLAERLEFIQAVAALEPQSVPLNFLNPIPGTPLADAPGLSPLEALAAVAVCKLHLPRVVIRTCGGRRQVLGRLAPLMYLAGAGATMTGDYLTTSGAAPSEDLLDIASLGLTTADSLL